uniref:NADH-ubiquinone oxidoreductase chain 6 n=1 Tax=Thenus orientalis TaxID=57071 RepID=A0A068WB73_THEOI|nr:NADH dehydrogenase subunit 6 [Thenus orientalis]CDR98454.1 NADH dehydrogenase subunit 6 [Thenus orientalis]
MSIILLPFIFFLSVLFTQLSHPLSAGIVLLIQTTLVALSSGLFSTSFWFSYILFLIFLGGMLVLFIYVASLASNEIFNPSLKWTGGVFFSSLFLIIGILMLDPIFSASIPPVALPSYPLETQMDIPPISTLQIYNFPYSSVTLFIILYLLLTLLVIVKITSSFFGPLRFSK